MKPVITINGKPLRDYLNHEIPRAMAEETQEELTEQEQEAADAATD